MGKIKNALMELDELRTAVATHSDNMDLLEWLDQAGWIPPWDSEQLLKEEAPGSIQAWPENDELLRAWVWRDDDGDRTEFRDGAWRFFDRDLYAWTEYLSGGGPWDYLPLTRLHRVDA